MRYRLMYIVLMKPLSKLEKMRMAGQGYDGGRIGAGQDGVLTSRAPAFEELKWGGGCWRRNNTTARSRNCLCEDGDKNIHHHYQKYKRGGHNKTETYDDDSW